MEHFKFSAPTTWYGADQDLDSWPNFMAIVIADALFAWHLDTANSKVA